MPQPQAMAANAPCPLSDADWIEQRIIRAYVQLALEPNDTDGSRAVTLAGLDGLEIRLTERSLDGIADLATFWLELRSPATGATLDSLGCHEFDEDEMSAAVAFVEQALHRLRTLH
ncbi:hypothetical protein [Microvirga ossetica]|nr:hypothetical protein [Microvirga ossetica]